MKENEKLETVKDYEIVLGSSFYDGLTPGADQYLKNTVKEYAEKIVAEASNIEKLDHVGDGSPEITAAHVEEAKHLSLRRLRKKARSTKWVAVLRLSQFLLSVLIGIGASNFKEIWGAMLCLISVFIASIVVFIERELTREL